MLKQIFIILLITIQLSNGRNNGPQTPTMGWISSKTLFNCDCVDGDNCLNEDNILQIADIMADNYLAVGYQYIILDNCWYSSERDENGALQADLVRFPIGMKAIADYLHNLGLKLGIYANYGSQTCDKTCFPGSIDFLQNDAATFEEWGVDFVKSDGFPLLGYYELTDSPITYFCSWPYYERSVGLPTNYEAISSYCNEWQNTDEITNDILSIIEISEFISRNQNIFSPVQGPGAYNYAGQLVIGCPVTGIQNATLIARTQMALWSIFASSLLISCDIRDIDQVFVDILTNDKLISINQDVLGSMGRKILIVDTYVAVYAKSLELDEVAFVCVNFFQSTDPKGRIITISLEDLGLTVLDSYDLFDSFNDEPIGTFRNDQSIKITVGYNYDVKAFYARSPESKLKQNNTNNSSLILRKKNFFNLMNLH